MSYTTTGITLVETFSQGSRLVLRVANAHPDKVLQCYVSGVLAAFQSAPAALWICELTAPADADVLFLLAVDPADAAQNVWAEAFDQSDAANRLRVRLPQTITPYQPHDRWRIYRGNAGDTQADRNVFTGPIYPGGRRACGFGSHLSSTFGYDGRQAAGLGAAFGAGEFGFDCQLLTWTSRPLSGGSYPVRVTIVDAAGNESPALATTVTLNTYARPATDLTVADYDAPTDTLTLTFTESEDI